MNEQVQSLILRKTGARKITHIQTIQNLWSGYGKIIRVGLEGASVKSIIVKQVQLPEKKNHPRGWNTDIGHQRKLKSYRVESIWYEKFSEWSKARLPKCLSTEIQGDEFLMLLEDLDEAGFRFRKRSVTWKEITACLKWLAQFHASFLGTSPTELWEVGTYWHLETRPHELEVLNDQKLKEAAPQIDQLLNDCTFKTLVHGDAKLANFCFSQDGNVAGVDFQYVGGGCGMKDVAYFIGSCLDEDECERRESRILDIYFGFLQQELQSPNEALEKEWRSLYRVAWADFHRFLKGWSPGHWKLNTYSERVTAEVIQNV